MNGKKPDVSAESIGTITAEERDEIRGIYERKMALIELFKTINDINKEDNAMLYEKLVKDMADTSSRYQRWFDEKSQKYSWRNIPGEQWRINFDTCEVLLVS
jgi:CXXX repeat modification system protein